MSAKITNEVLKGYLSCKTKGHLKLAGESGTPSEYEAMTAAAGQASREAALAKLVARFGSGDACRGIAVTAETCAMLTSGNTRSGVDQTMVVVGDWSAG